MWKRSFRARLPPKMWKLKMRKRSFRARPPSKCDCWRCENEAFMRDFLQKVKVEDVKMKLSCETPLKIWKWKMWKRLFRARLPSNLKVQVAKMKLSCETSFKIWKWTEYVRTKLSCETSLKMWLLKMWKQSFRARPPSKSESWRCENEAFVRDSPWSGRCENYAFVQDFLQILKVQVVNMKPNKLSIPPRGRSENDPGLNERVPKPSAGQASPSIFRTTFVLQNTTFCAPANSQKRISCEASLNKWKLKMWKRSFRARLPSKSES